MDFQKAGILLEKINALYKNMSVDAGSISEIEKDLMRAYLRQFYEYFMPQPGQASETEEPPVVLDLPIERKERKKPEALKPTVSEPKVAPPPPPPHIAAEEDEDEPEEIPAPRVIKVPDPPREIPRPKEKVQRELVSDSDDDLETLFEHHQAKELSEKLSELPIQDLSKAMGLNEKIFTINELFAGDQDAFKQIIQTLNGFRSFADAKEYLIQEAAFRFNWSHPERKNKAKNFIKLVRRRYIS